MTDDLFSFAGLPLEPVPLFVGPVSKHPLYAVWDTMNRRCHNPTRPNFKDYGGRGIVVCDEWRKSSRVFISWALANGWKPGLEIDRRDNDGPYAPWNCRFVTRVVNARNRRDTIRLSNGEAAIDAAERSGLCRASYKSRILRGWSPDEAIKPARAKRKHRTKDGRVALHVAAQNGIVASTFHSRMAQFGWSVDDAVTVPVGGKRPAPK